MRALGMLKSARQFQLVHDPGEVIEQRRIIRRALERHSQASSRTFVAFLEQVSLAEICKERRIFRMALDPILGHRVGLGALPGRRENRVGPDCDGSKVESL
jgi:hypothetical protein